jgi:hypothetical protein
VNGPTAKPMTDSERLPIDQVLHSYVDLVREELNDRWEQWKLDLAVSEMYEVVGALLARQVTLATQLALAPSIWNGHVAPLVLRSMIENYINLAWIFQDPVERSRQFVLHGLGQAKLLIEHRKTILRNRGDNADEDPLIQVHEVWLNSQRFSFLTEVNVGAWAGVDIREMASQTGCEDLYRLAYMPFSGATHNMWHHVEMYNLLQCANPLHQYHRVPIDPDLSPDIDYLYRAAKYVQIAFELFDAKTGISSRTESAFDTLTQHIGALGRSAPSGDDSSAESNDGADWASSDGGSTGLLIRTFVDEVAGLPQVERVLVVRPQSDGPSIWTLISAPPFEIEYREPIYQAQLRAIDAAPDALVQFRLVNLDELNQPTEQVVPTPHAIVYDRRSQA